jgi:hypothetical protein
MNKCLVLLPNDDQVRSQINEFSMRQYLQKKDCLTIDTGSEYGTQAASLIHLGKLQLSFFSVIHIPPSWFSRH